MILFNYHINSPEFNQHFADHKIRFSPVLQELLTRKQSESETILKEAYITTDPIGLCEHMRFFCYPKQINSLNYPSHCLDNVLTNILEIERERVLEVVKYDMKSYELLNFDYKVSMSDKQKLIDFSQENHSANIFTESRLDYFTGTSIENIHTHNEIVHRLGEKLLLKFNHGAVDVLDVVRLFYQIKKLFLFLFLFKQQVSKKMF